MSSNIYTQSNSNEVKKHPAHFFRFALKKISFRIIANFMDPDHKNFFYLSLNNRTGHFV